MFLTVRTYVMYVMYVTEGMYVMRIMYAVYKTRLRTCVTYGTHSILSIFLSHSLFRSVFFQPETNIPDMEFGAGTMYFKGVLLQEASKKESFRMKAAWRHIVLRHFM